MRGAPVDPGAIEKTALMTVEGERDDICGIGQTEAAHLLCRNLAPAKQRTICNGASAITACFTAAAGATKSIRRSPPLSASTTPPAAVSDPGLCMTPRIDIRFATAEDCALLLGLICALAVFERAPVAVIATEADLLRYGFGVDPQFEAILAFLDGEPAGFAAFHSRFSTWLGRPGMYLEDLFVVESARRHGVGRRLMTRLAAITIERGWGRIDFQVLDWNPARGFYERSGWARSATGYAMAATRRRCGALSARTK